MSAVISSSGQSPTENPLKTPVPLMQPRELLDSPITLVRKWNEPKSNAVFKDQKIGIGVWFG